MGIKYRDGSASNKIQYVIGYLLIENAIDSEREVLAVTCFSG